MGPDSKDLAYFARERGDAILVLNGEKRPSTRFPGLALTSYRDEKGNIVGSGLMMGGLHIDRQAFAKSLSLKQQFEGNPFSTVLIRGELSYIDSGEKESFVVIGAKREGPYPEINSVLLASNDKNHYAYIISIDNRQQVVLDGEIMPLFYDAIYRPNFIGNREFAHLAVKEGKVFRASYILPRK